MSSHATPTGLVVLGSLLPVLGLIALALRFYTRRLQKIRILADDWLVIPAEILLIALGVLLIVGVAGHGLGYNIPSEVDGIPTNGNSAGLAVEILTDRVEWLILTLSILQIGFAKLSILFFYRRIFDTSKTNILNAVTIAMIVLISIWSIAFFFANLFECGTNWTLNWLATIEQSLTECIQEQSMTQGFVFSDFILDVIIFIIPLPTVWKLHTTVKRRVGVMVILAIGALTVVASLVRTVIIVGVVYTLQNNLLSSERAEAEHLGKRNCVHHLQTSQEAARNSNLLVSIVLFWKVLESGLATVVICLPTFRGLSDKSPAILRSLRSMISLQSIHSRGSGNRTTRSGVHSSSGQSTSSHTEIAKIAALEAGVGYDAYAMNDFHQKPPLPATKPGIIVKSQITQDSSSR